MGVDTVPRAAACRSVTYPRHRMTLSHNGADRRRTSEFTDLPNSVHPIMRRIAAIIGDTSGSGTIDWPAH
jgi:hypothetical protein